MLSARVCQKWLHVIYLTAASAEGEGEDPSLIHRFSPVGLPFGDGLVIYRVHCFCPVLGPLALKKLKTIPQCNGTVSL